MKSITNIDGKDRHWTIGEEKGEIILKITVGRKEILKIAPLPENIVKTLKDNKIIK